MAIVTGDRYLEQLVKFVEKEAGSLVDGSTVLKLNPVGLHYVHTRFEALHELEGLLDEAPVDYLRAYVSDLGDHRALEQLRRMLRIVPSLTVVSVIPYPARDPTPLSLLPFSRLRVLELRCCDLSTSAAKGLLELRHTLEKIICYNSTDALRHVLASRMADIKSSPQWHRLNYVSFACNRLVVMDDSLQLLPSIDTLDLSRNRFAKVDNLKKCAKLKNLDLGFNHLRTVLPLREISSNLVKLIIRNNALSSLRGLEHIKSLEGLDVSYNIVSSFSELEFLSGLPNMQNLWLEGNPLSCSRWYRAHVFSYFAHPGKMKLDGKEIGTREFWKRQIIIASSYRLHSSYGFYLPAKDNSSDKEATIQKKRKVSRLASIESDDSNISVASDEESFSHDHHKEVTDRLLPEDKTEAMKKDSTIHWLREFRKWMEHKRSSGELTEDTQHINNHKSGFSSTNVTRHQSSSGPTTIDASVHDDSFDFQNFLVGQNCNPAMSEISSICLEEPYRKESALSGVQSPPHYKEDILQKRHNLVDLRSHSIWSSESTHSSSEDEYDINDAATNADTWSTHSEYLTSGVEGNGTSKQNKVRKKLISLGEHWISSDLSNPTAAIDSTTQPLVSEGTIEEYFKVHIGDSKVNETCRDYVHCDCVLEPQSLYRERELILLLSSQKKLYVLLISIAFDGSGHLILLDALKIEDVEEILVGLGLQVIRIFISKGATYLFQTGSITKSRHIISLLNSLGESEAKQVPPFKSLEPIQMSLFEKEICHGLMISIFQYSLVLFHNPKYKDVSWRRRSLFIAGGQLLICIEDFKRFNSSLSPSPTPYYSLDSSCFIGDLSELEVDTPRCCVTLHTNQTTNPVSWKLKWYSNEGFLNFITLLKAIHADVSPSRLALQTKP